MNFFGVLKLVGVSHIINNRGIGVMGHHKNLEEIEMGSVMLSGCEIYGMRGTI